MARQKGEHKWLSPKNFWPASAYLLLLGVFATVLVELDQEHHWIPMELLAGILLLIVLAGGWGLFERLRRAFAQPGFIRLLENEDVPGAAALIVFVSQKGGRTSALQAASYHAGCKTLKHVWLVTTRSAEEDAKWVAGEIGAQFPDVKIHETKMLNDMDSIPEAKSTVEDLRKHAIRQHKVAEPDLMCDFTGLTKNASAGMILACAPKDARLQYMVPNRRLDDGRADPAGGSMPREIFIQYTVIEEE